MMDNSIPNIGLMDMTKFWIGNIKGSIMGMTIGLAFQLLMYFKKIILQIPLKSLNI